MGATGTTPERSLAPQPGGDELLGRASPTALTRHRNPKLPPHRPGTSKAGGKLPTAKVLLARHSKTHLLLRRFKITPGAHRKRPPDWAPPGSRGPQAALGPALAGVRLSSKHPKPLNGETFGFRLMCERRGGRGTGSWREKSLKSREKAWIEIQLFQLLLFCPQPPPLKGMKCWKSFAF